MIRRHTPPSVRRPGPAAALLALVAGLFAAASPAAMSGDDGVLRLESHGPDQGLPQSTVRALANDDQGFLWAATQDGLVRFDGHRFEVLRAEGGSRGLASGSIDAMVFDPHGQQLWLGTNDAGVDIVHLPTWSHQRLDRSNGLAHNKVNALALDGREGAWIASAGGIDHFTYGANGAVHLGGDAGIVDVSVLPGPGVALALGRDCRLWRATRSRLDLLASLPAASGDCVALASGAEGAWIASAHAGVFLVDPASGQVRRRVPPATLFPDGAPLVTALLRRSDGSLLVGLRDGRIARLGSPKEAPTALVLDQPLGSAVTSLHEDPSGALWIGTYTSGMHYARPLSAAIRAGSSDAGTEGGWPDGSMRAILVDGGHALVGSDNGLFERLSETAHWRRIPAFEGQSVRVIARAHGGGWWIGSQDGLFHWSGGSSTRAVAGLPDDRIDAILVEGEDGWIGTRGGLARLSHGRIIDDPALAPLRHSHVTALLRSGGRLWIATNADGLWRLDQGAAAAERVFQDQLHHSLWSLWGDAQALWVGSYSRGVYRIDHASGEVTGIGRADGLGNGVIYALLADGRGRVWASTNNGLSVIDPASGTIQVLGRRDGLANREYNSGSAFRDADGLLLFGGTRGIDVLDPSALPPQSAPARPLLTTLRALSLDADGTGSREKDIVYAREVDLEHRDRMITIRMTALDFAAPDAARLRYRVLGMHQDWVYPHAPVAEFSVTALPPGSYLMEVEAAGRDGRFGSARRLRLDMAPPWWRHPLAYAAYLVAALALLALVAGSIRGRIRRERRQVELLERTVAERTAQLQLANQSLSLTNAQLTIATRRDPLTRVSNRRDLQEWLGREASALRSRAEATDGTIERLVFLMIDIDDFKRINDVHGHQAGDEVLVHFADRLRLLSRDDDLLVRWGGEEFLLVSRFARADDAALLAERIRAAIASQPIRLGRGTSLDLTCSIGFAPWPFSLDWPGLGDWSACLGLADRCLYMVKRGTKNGWAGMVPGDAPGPDAIQALLAGAHPDDVGAGVVRLLHSEGATTRVVD